MGDMSLTVARIAVLIVGTLLGVIIGYLISSFILKQGLVIAKRLERLLTHIPNQEFDCRHPWFIYSVLLLQI